MKRIRSAEEDFKAPSCFTMEGYLYIQEKREIHRNRTLSVCLCVVCCEENQMPKEHLDFIMVTQTRAHLHESVCYALQVRWAACGRDTTVLIKKAQRCSPWATQSPDQPADRWAAQTKNSTGVQCFEPVTEITLCFSADLSPNQTVIFMFPTFHTQSHLLMF